MDRRVDIVRTHAEMFPCTPCHRRCGVHVHSPLTRTDSRWVNGSEKLYQKQKKKWQDKSPIYGGSSKTADRKIKVTERRHREHDELRYSIRSMFKYFNRGFSQIRILASDLLDDNRWIGQVPSWLNLEAAQNNRVSMFYTSELYGALKHYLPVFNSLALEAQMRNVPPVDPD